MQPFDLVLQIIHINFTSISRNEIENLFSQVRNQSKGFT